MNTTNTKWRLIEPEDARLGDELQTGSGDWIIINEPWGDYTLQQHRKFFRKIRRAMTPAEIHAEELVSAVQNLFLAFETGGDSEEGHALMGLHKALCKSMGREVPIELQVLDAVLNPEQ